MSSTQGSNLKAKRKAEISSGYSSLRQTSSSKYYLNSSSPKNTDEKSSSNINSYRLRCPFCYSKILPFSLNEESLVFVCSSSESLSNSSQVCSFLITSPSKQFTLQNRNSTFSGQDK